MSTFVMDYHQEAASSTMAAQAAANLGLNGMNGVNNNNMNPMFAAPQAAANAHNPASPTATLKSSSPRMVSLTNMANTNDSFNAAPKRQPSSTTPFDSLKALVRNKKRTSSMLMMQSADVSETKRFQNVLLPSSQASRQAFISYNNKSVEAPLPKRQRVHHQQESLLTAATSAATTWVVPQGESDLHRACVQGNQDAIVNLVAQDRVQAARAIRITTTKQIYHFGTYQLEEQQVCESYAFALNLAIRTNKVDSATLQALAKAAPGVLSTPDGDAQESALAVLLKTRPQDVATADEFLLQNPACATVTDRKGNTPLHIACQARGGGAALLDTIRRLVILYPQALFSYNAQGENPLMIAQRCSHLGMEEVATYLWEKQAEAL